MDWKVSLFWLALVVFFAIIEGVTPQLVSIWFAGGALVSLVVSLFGAPIWVEAIVFVAVSAILLVLTRPIVKRRFAKQIVKTNADALVGGDAVVTRAIDNTEGVGLAKILGQVWSARSADGGKIPEGATVTVERIEGVKLIVSEKKPAEDASKDVPSGGAEDGKEE